MATQRELDWWNVLSSGLQVDISIHTSIVPHRFQSTYTLADFDNHSKVKRAPFYDDLSAPSLSDIWHESKHYPGRSLSFYYLKYSSHYNAYLNFFASESFDLVIFENGAFIFINALVSVLRNIEIPFIAIEPGPFQQSSFLYLNSKGPCLTECLKPLTAFKNNIQHVGPLVQFKDRSADNIIRFLDAKLPLKLFSFFSRSVRSPYFNIDGDFFQVSSVRVTFILKKLFIWLHNIKASTLVGLQPDSSAIVVPLHLFKDLAINERFGVSSQIDFLYYLKAEHTSSTIFFKLHPHAVKTGLTFSDHLRLLFSPFLISNLPPSKLDPTLHEVHTLGSKYGFESSSYGVPTYCYGNTFYNLTPCSF